jgi:hypothetical protein
MIRQASSISLVESIVTSGGIDDHRGAPGVVIEGVQVDLVVSAWL